MVRSFKNARILQLLPEAECGKLDNFELSVTVSCTQSDEMDHQVLEKPGAVVQFHFFGEKEDSHQAKSIMEEALKSRSIGKYAVDRNYISFEWEPDECHLYYSIFDRHYDECPHRWKSMIDSDPDECHHR
ncbi:uncharacterized protein CEXT_567871 [Caerostris extrusa]|uniref:Uncharacterized protein n=1 Tax=Caerostris extrusa TaxID=172846 RepID=A0AAV4TX73_CAEEX|nr:uncharacterized protein CEXT_567871 [Caerostris extrusa]